MKLSQQNCTACNRSAPRVEQGAIPALMNELPDWNIVQREGVNQLNRTFPFDNFAAALAFTNQVGELAEAENHHPQLVTEWGSVTVYWWTHKIKGLHQNDFILAARTDELLAA